MSAGIRWRGQSIRVEHLVSAGPWLTNPGTHLESCACRCADVQTCPECGEPSFPSAIAGRWDAGAGHTARPFDAVWVRLACGCEFGDYEASRPTSPADTESETEA
jgi:hypothetical protein